MNRLKITAQCRSGYIANQTHFSEDIKKNYKMFCNITWATPSSQPRITSCLPILNLKGFPRSREESNLRPSVREPEKNRN